MKSIILSVLFLGAFVAQGANIEGLSGFGICSDNPVSLVPWYENLGIQFTKVGNSGAYSAEAGSVFPFHMGIYPTSPKDPHCSKRGAGFGINFKVKDFEKFLKQLKAKGIVPFAPPMKEEWGCIALLKDSDGNNVSFFAQAKKVDGNIVCE